MHVKGLAAIVKRRFWPISAVVFGPWHAPLCVWAILRLTAGTALGTYLAAHEGALRPTVVVIFSLYFTLALMMWVAGKRAASREADAQEALGLSGRQIVGWGLLGILTIPLFIWLSTVEQQGHVIETFRHIFGRDRAANMGLIWLVSIAMLIMMPTMVVWLVWMWRAWTKTDRASTGVDDWDYEYEA